MKFNVKISNKILAIILILIIISSLAISYAYIYFEIRSPGTPITISNMVLSVEYDATGGNISASDIIAPWSSTKTFTVTNNGNNTFKYNIIIDDLVNTLTSDTLTYTITEQNNSFTKSSTVLPTKTAESYYVLGTNIEIEPDETQTFTIVFTYPDSSTVDQSDDMGKSFSGTILIEQSSFLGSIIYDNPNYQIVVSDAMFAHTTENYSSENGLWSESRSGKTEDGKTVYFYRGAVQNNWVYFAGVYWRIIRTNKDGSVRLLYSGTTHNTTTGYINETTYAFNTSYDNAKYVGYMYSTSDEDTLAANRTDQTTPSTAATTINDWYETNIVDNNYSSYINSDAVYCVDRNAYDSSGNTYTTPWSSSTTYYFGAYDRLSRQKTPTYVCSNASDKFTSTSSTVGVKKLTYPVALMTADELAYAGGVYGSSYSSNYPWYYTNSAGGSITGSSSWWLLSPSIWFGSNSYAVVFLVDGSSSPASLGNFFVNYTRGLRPTVSVKSCVIATGHGTSTDPYILSIGNACSLSNN